MASSKAKEKEDLAAIQAQLQLERAQLTNEIGHRLTSLSAASSPIKFTNKSKNPFSMSRTHGDASSSSSSLSSSPFSHRPATLGLGAEASEQDKAQASSSLENARLKGAIMGKRKRETERAEERREEEDEEDSKFNALGKGSGKDKVVTANGKGKTISKVDPFASKKGKGKKNGTSEEPTVLRHDKSGQPAQEQLLGLSKSAKKKLRKRMKREAGVSEESKEGVVTRPIEVGRPLSNGLHNHKTETETEGGRSAMTAHQKSMLSHLSGARFRQINETLYSTSSSSAMSYIQSEPSKLREYHEGFREQVKGWPKVPVRQIAEKILKGQTQQQKGAGRFAPGALVIDLGAGEAFLGKILAREASKVRVLSYDLLDSDDGWVKGLDIAKLNGLPLPGTLGPADEESSHVVDVAVFCLSLMGTNWVEMIMEASRVLRSSGELIIAEVTSRFNTKADFIEIVSSLGFKLVQEDSSNSHFVTFDFVKLGKSDWDSKAVQAEQDRATAIEAGSKVLKPCLYKRR
ncbi:hypothetical protein CBS101457_000385 [Exobasidium rhododendri]|nr:hypothetical protein CBS101457_000385 [Exobasidium rhododendri]